MDEDMYQKWRAARKYQAEHRLPNGKCVCDYCHTLDRNPLVVTARFEYAISTEWPEWKYGTGRS